jgi:F0F1-type ATP synthase delta subunit
MRYLVGFRAFTEEVIDVEAADVVEAAAAAREEAFDTHGTADVEILSVEELSDEELD